MANNNNGGNGLTEAERQTVDALNEALDDGGFPAVLDLLEEAGYDLG